jgi:phosphatidate cytidylyltransferase
VSAAAVAQPAGSALASALATRVATGIVLVAGVLAALFLLPPPGFGIVVLMIVAAGAHEWAKLVGFARGAQALFVAVTLVAGAALLWAGIDRGWRDIVIVVCGVATLYWIVVGAPSVLLRRQFASPLVLAISGWIVLLGAFVAIAALQSHSPWLALAAMAIVWIADTAAYFAGRRFGRHRLAPQISPGKTWEGAYGGIAAVVVYALALLPLAARAGFAAPLDAMSVGLWILFSAALAALSIVGDLYESQLKRRAGVKDSGTLLPGHGGVLDRTDALLAAMPPIALAALAWLARA